MTDAYADISDALMSLYSHAEWTLEGDTYGGLTWLDKVVPKPTEEELTTETARILEQRRSEAYREKRAAQYPVTGDQLDAILKGFEAVRAQGTTLPDDLNNLIETWKTVKETIPKEGIEL